MPVPERSIVRDCDDMRYCLISRHALQSPSGLSEVSINVWQHSGGSDVDPRVNYNFDYPTYNATVWQYVSGNAALFY